MTTDIYVVLEMTYYRNIICTYCVMTACAENQY